MHSTFRISTAFRHGRTKIDDVYFEAPFKLMSPFMSGRHADVMVMFASPGFLAGDKANIDCTFGAGSDTTIATQSYEKVFDTQQSKAERTIRLETQGDAAAVFLPFPVIPFRNSTFANTTIAHLSPESTFVYADVVACGRVGMAERWAMRSYSSRLRVYVDTEPSSPKYIHVEHAGASAQFPHDLCNSHKKVEHLVFADHMLLNPDRFNYQEMGMWRQYTHNGLLYAHIPEIDPGFNPEIEQGKDNLSPYAASSGLLSGSKDPRMIKDIRSRIAAAHIVAEDALIVAIRKHAEDSGFDGELGVSRVTNGICVRILTTSGERAFDFIRAISNMIRSTAR